MARRRSSSSDSGCGCLLVGLAFYGIFITAITNPIARGLGLEEGGRGYNWLVSIIFIAVPVLAWITISRVADWFRSPGARAEVERRRRVDEELKRLAKNEGERRRRSGSE